jgi:hypothetical protein
MAHQVQVNVDEIVLPDGREYGNGAVVTLTDREFNQIRSSLFSGGSPALTDLGEVAGTSGDLSGLGDVVIDSPQVGDLVKWDGSHWVNAQPDPDIDVGGAAGGGASLLTASPVVGFRYAGNVSAHPDPPDLFGFSTPPLTQIQVFDAEGVETDYDPVTLLDGNAVVAVPGASDFAIQSNADTSDLPQAGLMEPGLYTLSGGAIFGDGISNSDVGVRILWVNLSASGDIGGNSGFEMRAFNQWPNAGGGAFVPLNQTLVTQFDLASVGLLAGFPSRIAIGVEQTSDVDPLPVVVTLYFHKVL